MSSVRAVFHVCVSVAVPSFYPHMGEHENRVLALNPSHLNNNVVKGTGDVADDSVVSQFHHPDDSTTPLDTPILTTTTGTCTQEIDTRKDLVYREVKPYGERRRIMWGESAVLNYYNPVRVEMKTCRDDPCPCYSSFYQQKTPTFSLDQHYINEADAKANKLAGKLWTWAGCEAIFTVHFKALGGKCEPVPVVTSTTSSTSTMSLWPLVCDDINLDKYTGSYIIRKESLQLHSRSDIRFTNVFRFANPIAIELYKPTPDTRQRCEQVINGETITYYWLKTADIWGYKSFPVFGYIDAWNGCVADFKVTFSLGQNNKCTCLTSDADGDCPPIPNVV